MACWICTFGSAYSSTLELNSAIRYFQALTNGLAMGSFRLRVCWLPVRSRALRLPQCQLSGLIGPATPQHPDGQATAMDTGCGMTTLVVTSMLEPADAAVSLSSRADSAAVPTNSAPASSRANSAPASVRTRHSGTSNAAQIALSSSLDASLRPRSTSDR